MVRTLAISCLMVSCWHAGAQTAEIADSASIDLHRKIIWHPDRPTEAAFLPDLLLEEGDLSALPLTAQQRETLARLFDQRRNPERSYHPLVVARGVPCLENSFGARHEADRAEDAVSLAELVREAPLAFLGQVVAVVHGKDDLTLGVGRIIYLEVKEILSAVEAVQDDAPRLGEVVAVLKEGGSIHVGGVAICEEIPGEFQQPEVADWLLVLGEPAGSGSPLMRWSQTFPVDGGEVLPQPYYRLRAGEKPQALSAIRAKVGTGG